MTTDKTDMLASVTVGVDLREVREWAEKFADSGKHGLAQAMYEFLGNHDPARPALPEVIVDGDKLREVLADMKERLQEAGGGEFDNGFDAATAKWKSMLQDLLPAPEPRVEVRLGAWAMHPEHGKVLITSAQADSEGDVLVSAESEYSSIGTKSEWVHHVDLSPLPDTDTETTTETVAEHAKVAAEQAPFGSSETTPEPQPEDIPGGEPWEVSVGNGQEYVGIRSETGIWELFDREDGNHSRWGRSRDVTPLHRLAPERTPRVLETTREYAGVAVGTVIRLLAHGPDVQGVVWEKTYDGVWRSIIGTRSTDAGMAGVPRTVLWEPGEDHQQAKS